MRRKVYLPAMAILILFAMACASSNMAMKPWSEQSPKERLVWMQGIYNAQDRDYRVVASMPNISEAQKRVLNVKKQIMTQVYPLINAYRITVEGGGTPDAATEQAILNLLNQLQTVGG